MKMQQKLKNDFGMILQVDNCHTYTVWKVSKYRVFSGLYFPAFGLNTERYGVSVRMQENTE